MSENESFEIEWKFINKLIFGVSFFLIFYKGLEKIIGIRKLYVSGSHVSVSIRYVLALVSNKKLYKMQESYLKLT